MRPRIWRCSSKGLTQGVALARGKIKFGVHGGLRVAHLHLGTWCSGLELFRSLPTAQIPEPEPEIGGTARIAAGQGRYHRDGLCGVVTARPVAPSAVG